jgi:hypothetical protein
MFAYVAGMTPRDMESHDSKCEAALETFDSSAGDCSRAIQAIQMRRAPASQALSNACAQGHDDASAAIRIYLALPTRCAAFS